MSFAIYIKSYQYLRGDRYNDINFAMWLKHIPFVRKFVSRWKRDNANRIDDKMLILG